MSAVVEERLEKPARADALPEFADYYQDTGCDLAPRCLTCPFEVCRYDKAVTAQRSAQNKSKAIELKVRGWSIDDIARELNIGRRQVFRYLETAHAGPNLLAD